MDIHSFYDAICDIRQTEEDRDLGPFLLALYPLLKGHSKAAPSLELFLKLIKQALKNKPIPFDPNWATITSTPITSGITRKFTHPDLNLDNSDIPLQETSIEFTLDVLKFQSAELQRMEGKQLANEMRFFGVISDHGYDWYNFTALSVLECGIACSIDNEDDHTTVTWGTLGQFLEDGRIYE